MIYTPDTGVLIQEEWLKKHAFSEYTTPPDNPELWGLAQYNPLLNKDIEISAEALETTQEIGLHPYLSACIQVNINGGLLVPEWKNCFRHNVLAGQFNMADAALIGAKQLQILQAGATGLLHDASQRVTKERMKSYGTCQNGEFTTRIVSPQELFAAEWNDQPINGVEGIDAFTDEVLTPTRVTHLDWRMFIQNQWTLSDKMARLMDSCIAAPRDENGAYGEDTILDPFERINMLKVYKPELDEEGLKPEYYGRRTFDVLADITRSIIPNLTELAMQSNPEYINSCPNNDYICLIRSIVNKQIPFPAQSADVPFM